VEIHIDTVEADEEIDEGLLLGFGYVFEESGCDGFSGWEGFGDRNVKDEGFGVNITNVDASFVSEENCITLACRCDTDIVFSIGGMRKEGFDNEIVERSCDSFDLMGLNLLVYIRSRVVIKRVGSLDSWTRCDPGAVNGVNRIGDILII
jgi:hypothetical protein